MVRGRAIEQTQLLGCDCVCLTFFTNASRNSLVREFEDLSTVLFGIYSLTG